MVYPCELAAPFDDPEWIYEIKHDGFRALAVEQRQCRFVSRKQHRLSGFRDLGEAIVKEIYSGHAILDGELVATDHLGRTVFAALMEEFSPLRFLGIRP